MGYRQSLIIVLLASHVVAVQAAAGERARSRDDPAAVGGAKSAGQAPLDRVAIAIDGAESSHGKDPGMWRPDPSAPQGPMQVSEAAATDVGGGDRFDMVQNRTIGRAYLAQLYWRYRNWPDAIAAYNWGVGKMDAWVKAGRPPDKFLAGVAVYLRRVLHGSGLCNPSETTPIRQVSGIKARNHGIGLAVAETAVRFPTGSLAEAACSGPEFWGGALYADPGSSRFSKKLEQAMQLAVQHGARGP
jgi:hypothetical protein